MTKDLRKSHKSPFVIVLTITLCSLDVNISSVCTTASDKGQEQRCPWITCLYRLQCVQTGQFVASRLTIFAAQPRTMDRCNVKLARALNIYSKVC